MFNQFMKLRNNVCSYSPIPTPPLSPLTLVTSFPPPDLFVLSLVLAASFPELGTATPHTNKPFLGFFMDKLGKICRHYWKGRIKVSRIAKFKSEPSYSSAMLQNLQTVGVGQVHTNVCQISRL